MFSFFFFLIRKKNLVFYTRASLFSYCFAAYTAILNIKNKGKQETNKKEICLTLEPLESSNPTLSYRMFVSTIIVCPFHNENALFSYSTFRAKSEPRQTNTNTPNLIPKTFFKRFYVYERSM